MTRNMNPGPPNATTSIQAITKFIEMVDEWMRSGVWVQCNSGGFYEGNEICYKMGGKYLLRRTSILRRLYFSHSVWRCHCEAVASGNRKKRSGIGHFYFQSSYSKVQIQEEATPKEKNAYCFQTDAYFNILHPLYSGEAMYRKRECETLQWGRQKYVWQAAGRTNSFVPCLEWTDARSASAPHIWRIGDISNFRFNWIIR